MAENMKGLLLEDHWAPVTSEMGFLETTAEHAARAFAEWQGNLMMPRGISVEVRPVPGPLEQTFSALLPLTSPEVQRHLFVPTRSSWTGFVENARGGTDAASTMAYMARTLGCRGVRVVAVPHTLREDKGRHGAVMFEVYGPRSTDGRNSMRTLYAANDGGRWVFGQSGEPFPFEEPERYQARKVRDRFTLNMLAEYLRHLGLSPFAEDFYLPDREPAWLVEKSGPALSAQGEYTLAQVREQF
ncbi:hypothetical protein P2318_33645 [Myxococcaceae bacterium GXIMD 01537]